MPGSQRAGPREGQGASGRRRADLRPGGRGGARRQGRRPETGPVPCSAGRTATAAARSSSGSTASAPPWHDDDLAAIAAAGPDGVVVPKVNSVGRRAGHRGRPGGGRRRLRPHRASGPCSRRRWPCCTPRRSPPPRPGSPCWSWAPTTWPRSCTPSRCPEPTPPAGRASACLLAARPPARSSSTASTTTSPTRPASRPSAVQGRQLGFDGKTLIHPSQVEPCNRAFAPSDDELVQARAHHRGLRGGRGRGTGRGHRRRPDDREPARRQRPSGPGGGPGHRRPVLAGARGPPGAGARRPGFQLRSSRLATLVS